MTGELVVRLALSGVATTLAALAAERALRDVGRPARFVWAGTMLVTALLGAVIVAGGSLPFAMPRAIVEAMSSLAPSPAGHAPLMVETRQGLALEPVLSPVAAAWLALSGALALAFGVALARQQRRVRRGTPARVDGVDVLVTPSLGPAVVGYVRPRIVLPAWLLERPESERRLVVRHEREHVAARDPLLAGLALVLVCLMPWHPLLWLQMRRLRLAIELDCDARVLRSGDAREYGRLLVDVAERLARGTPLATALAFPRNFLERRIRMITNRRTRPLRAVALTIGAGGLLLAACAETRDPVAVEPVETEVVERPVEIIVDGERLSPTQTAIARYRTASPEEAGSSTDRTPNIVISEMKSEDIQLRSPDMSLEGHRLVPFTATLGTDDRPATIEFEEGTPPEIQARAREALSTGQFRRTVENPDAPVEGVVGVVEP